MHSFAAISLLFADLLVGTWNLKWFPSGDAEHRASPRVEAANIADAADGVKAVWTNSSDHVIFFFEEVRSSDAVEGIFRQLNATNVKVAVTSQFKERDGRLGWQQIAIATDLPVIDASYSYWRHIREVWPPRGYSTVIVDGGEKYGAICCYGVHLKSNYGATNLETVKANAAKREASVKNIADNMKRRSFKANGEKIRRVILAGDFNVDAWQKSKADEQTIPIVGSIGFYDCWNGVPDSQRGSHPSNSKRYGDSTLDYIFLYGFDEKPMASLGPHLPVSDHRMVYIVLK